MAKAETKSPMKVVLTVGVVVVALVVLVAVLADMAPKNSDRIKDACNREYGFGTPASQDCQITLTATAIKSAEDAKLRRAARDAGVIP